MTLQKIRFVVLALAIIAGLFMLAGCREDQNERAMFETAQKYLNALTAKDITSAATLVIGDAEIDLRVGASNIKADESNMRVLKANGELIYLNRDKTRGVLKVTFLRQHEIQGIGKTVAAYEAYFGLYKLGNEWKIYSVRIRPSDSA